MAERDAQRPPSSRDIAGEDFLFHLYRGSEMLQDNRVHDAKAELEQALSLQPSDPKGQDLLGIVYFRLGLYPRAIAIYEQLIRLHPEAIEPRINLALSYLKTGQAAPARFELEKVVEQSPGHSRAWGYLGLAFQRLGDYERASYAFQAGGHDGMARRLIEMTASGGALSIRPEPPPAPRPDARRDAAPPSTVLRPDDPGQAPGADRPADAPPGDAGPRAVDAALGAPPSLRLGEPGLDDDGARASRASWSGIEPGALRPPIVPSIPPGYEVARFAPAPVVAPPAPAAPPESAPASLRPQASAPRRPADLARDTLLLFPRDIPVSLHAGGMVLVQATSGFATRIEAVRSMAYAAGHTSTVLQRRARGRLLDEPLGGPASPLVELGGKVELVLGAAASRRLEVIGLADEAIYLREDTLVGFESTVGWENGRLAVGDGDALPMVQLRGPGAVVASLPERCAAVEVVDGRTLAVRGGNVLGWIGRVVPRALLGSEAPVGVRGFVAFAGEGMVLVDER